MSDDASSSADIRSTTSSVEEHMGDIAALTKWLKAWAEGGYQPTPGVQPNPLSPPAPQGQPGQVQATLMFGMRRSKGYQPTQVTQMHQHLTPETDHSDQAVEEQNPQSAPPRI
jgi:hypothetical protein